MKIEGKLLIYLADDHNLVANGISSLIQNIAGVGELKIFNNGKALYDACEETQPDLVFLDVEMPVWDGRKTLTAIRKDYPHVRCLMLSMFNEKAIIDDCITKGASGYLNKDCTLEELSEAIHQKSELYFSKEVLKSLSGYRQQTVSQFVKLNEPLTEREREILSYLCDGYSPKEIADKIHLSNRTVETHKTSIMQKFEVNSIGKLISIAIKNRIV